MVEEEAKSVSGFSSYPGFCFVLFFSRGRGGGGGGGEEHDLPKTREIFHCNQ